MIFVSSLEYSNIAPAGIIPLNEDASFENKNHL
jgi:hypothetical protein